jgi:hypothetical protein
MKIIAGTGSRSFVLEPSYPYEFYKWLHERLHTRDESLMLMSGMAEGWDEFVARAAIACGFPWIAAVPNRGYGEYYWGRHSRSGENRYEEFKDLLCHANEVVYVCNSIKVNGVHSNFLRNQWMVDNADEFVVYCPTSRGTADCMRRIKLAGLPYTEFFSNKEGNIDSL